ncbi:CHAP domain-containing protein, partial [Candidatus Saccharibacteria bacterium]|nr:CHAP domain-containing protein [Candidatus Saccharibacteria bacterium]
GGASTVELLVGSDSFTTFFNEQTYLERLKTGVQESTEKVITLKDQIKSQQEQQVKLLEQQKAQQALVASTKTEKQQVLAQTQGQEGEYRERSKQLLAEQRAAQEEIVKQSVFVSTSEPVVQVNTPVPAPTQNTSPSSSNNANNTQPAPTPAPIAPVSSSYPYRNAVCVGTGRVDGPCYDFVWQMPDGRVIDEWTYYMRNCTSYVAFRIAGNGHSSAVRWLGNGGQWYSRAAAKGIAVGQTPRVGAAVSFNFRVSPYGHVAYVEEVYGGGSQFKISEYNMRLDGTYTSRIINTSDPTVTGFVYF